MTNIHRTMANEKVRITTYNCLYETTLNKLLKLWYNLPQVGWMNLYRESATVAWYKATQCDTSGLDDILSHIIV